MVSKVGIGFGERIYTLSGSLFFIFWNFVFYFAHHEEKILDSIKFVKNKIQWSSQILYQDVV